MAIDTVEPRKRIGYIRVSTAEQRPDRQIDGLLSECDEIRIEQGVSATAKRRPIFEGLLEDLAQGDVLVVWNLDRAFRSSIDAIQAIDNLKAKGVHLHIVNMKIDTTTPEGRFVYTVIAGIAEMERATLVRRTKEGLASARRRGQRLGRPPVLSDADVRVARDLMDQSSETLASMARRLGCHPRTLSRALSNAA